MHQRTLKLHGLDDFDNHLVALHALTITIWSLNVVNLYNQSITNDRAWTIDHEEIIYIL